MGIQVIFNITNMWPFVLIFISVLALRGAPARLRPQILRAFAAVVDSFGRLLVSPRRDAPSETASNPEGVGSPQQGRDQHGGQHAVEGDVCKGTATVQSAAIEDRKASAGQDMASPDVDGERPSGLG